MFSRRGPKAQVLSPMAMERHGGCAGLGHAANSRPSQRSRTSRSEQLLRVLGLVRT
jgi:hypothetical protein